MNEIELEKYEEQIKEGKVEEIMITVRERLAINNKKIFEDGKTEGIAQGIARGISQVSVDIAKKLKKMGMTKEDIEKATGINVEELKK